jgi:hypothetical protein
VAEEHARGPAAVRMRTGLFWLKARAMAPPEERPDLSGRCSVMVAQAQLAEADCGGQLDERAPDQNGKAQQQ